MCCICHIVPQDVLKRFSNDSSLSAERRKNFSDTLKIDTEMRKLRTQANKLTRVASLVAPNLLAASAGATGATAAAAPVAPPSPPTITVYDTNHGQALPGVQIDTPATSPDVTAMHVFTETTSVAAFYAQVFGRDSVDGAGLTLNSSIHYGTNYNNAFWNGSQMTYGDGDGSIFIDFSKGNDVIGHELTHGVTQHSLQLNYTSESGGLNESLSDCFGSMFRQWEAKQTVQQADWLIGKDIMGPDAIAKGYSCLRDLADPAAQHCLTPQPTQYSQFQTGMDPHISSGITNLAFSTIANAVGGNSWEKVGQIWYKAMTGFGPTPTMKMSAFANRTRAVAAQLYASDPTVAGAVDTGWKKVGL